LSSWFPKKGGYPAFFYTCVIYAVVAYGFDSKAILPDIEDQHTGIQKQTKLSCNKRIVESGALF